VKNFSNLSFAHVRSENIYFVAITKTNADIALVFETLNRVVEICRAYFGGKLNEEAIKNHFILAYELLDGKTN
jgi:AP-2 complex subunit mu-1